MNKTMHAFAVAAIVAIGFAQVDVYATRMRDRTQHLSLATSQDGVHFEKTEPNPFASPPMGYSPCAYRDPVVFQDQDEGLFHILVTAHLEDWPIGNRGGCLAHHPCSEPAHAAHHRGCAPRRRHLG